MQRNESKLARIRKTQEDIDERLKEAGMYEEGLNQETKVQLLQFLEESRESARIEEEERRNLHRQEQKIFTETLNKSYTHKESGGSSSSSSKCRKEVNVEETAIISMSPALHIQQEAKSSPLVSPKSAIPQASCLRQSVIKSSSNLVGGLHTHTKDEDDELVLLTQKKVDDLECQIVKTRTENSSSTVVEAPQSFKGKYCESVIDINAPISSHPCSSPMAVSPVLTKKRMIPTNTITTEMTGDDNDTKNASPIHKSPKLYHKRIPNPHVLLFPLTQTSSLVKNVSLSSKKDLTSPMISTPARKKLPLSHRKNASPQNFAIENSPSIKKNLTSSPRNSPRSSGSTTPTLSPDFIPCSASPSGALTPSKDADTDTPSKKSDSPNFSRNSATPSIRRNLATSLVEDSSFSRNNKSTVSPSSEASITTSTASTITTTTSATIPTHALATSTTTTTTTSDEGVKVLGSPSNASPQFDLENKITLQAVVMRSLDVFSCSQAHEVILRRKRPLSSEVAGKSFHRGPNESPQQCRSRILTLIDNMAMRLQQHQSNLPALTWSLPLTVDCRLKHSLDRTKQGSRWKLQPQQLEEVMEREESKQRHTRQSTRYTREALKSHLDPIMNEGTTRVGLPAHSGRGLGSKRGKRPVYIPLPKVSSESDTDLEIDHAKPPIPSLSQSNSLPYPLKAKGTMVNPDSKVKSQPQLRRKTFRLDTDSEASDNECHVKADVTGMNNSKNTCISPGKRDGAASPTYPLSELCIIEDEQSHPNLARPAIRKLARRGTRRPAPEPTGSAPTKLRKTHTLNRENSTGSTPDQTTQLSPTSSVFTHLEGETESNTKRRQNQKEEEGEKVLCPICQRLYPLQEIEVHASDCMEMEDNQQQMHEGAPTLSPRRQRRMNEESAVAVMSESEKSEESNKEQRCSLCKENFDNPDDLQLHTQYCNKTEEAIVWPSSSSSSSTIRKTFKKKVKVLDQALSQDATMDRGGLSHPGSLLANVEGNHSTLQP